MNELKKFEEYKNKMTETEILTFAKYGFISRQIHQELFKELKK